MDDLCRRNQKLKQEEKNQHDEIIKLWLMIWKWQIKKSKNFFFGYISCEYTASNPRAEVLSTNLNYFS